tara:strand:+ start:69 stop:596 length:528 start_codon:yes stop_codon:yes gene_type:complete
MNLETISGNFYILLYTECKNLISRICSDPIINKECPQIDKLEDYMNQTFIPSKNTLDSIKSSSTRKKTILTKEERCCAIKKDLEQCTRRKREGQEFCGKHIDKQPYGVADDKTTDIDLSQHTTDDPDDLPVYVENFNGTDFLVDVENFVYTYDIDNPERVGIKISEGVMTLLDDI